MTGGVTDPAGAAGDSAGAAFEVFQAAWPDRQAGLRRHAARRLAERRVPTSWMEADDVVQMTWLVLHRNRNRVERLDRYMYTVAPPPDRAECAVDPEKFGHGVWPLLPDAAVSQPEQEFIHRETAAELAEARHQLTGRQSFVLASLVDEGSPIRMLPTSGTSRSERSRPTGLGPWPCSLSCSTAASCSCVRPHRITSCCLTRVMSSGRGRFGHRLAASRSVARAWRARSRRGRCCAAGAAGCAWLTGTVVVAETRPESSGMPSCGAYP